MRYAIKNTETGNYVTRPGSSKSYTRNLRIAQLYETREAADANRCVDNERVVPVDVTDKWERFECDYWPKTE